MAAAGSANDGRGAMDPPPRDTDHFHGDATQRVVVVGLVADPGLPSKIARGLSEQLPGDLSRYVSADVTWEVRLIQESLPLDDAGHVPLLAGSERVLTEQRWDMMVALTELPREVGSRPMLCQVSAGHSVALISLPALGTVRVRQRARSTILEIVRQLAQRESGHLPAQQSPSPRRNVMAPRLSPVQPVPGSDEDSRFYGLGPVGGRVRLLLGMVRNNRPWRLVPSLSGAIAAAAAASAFGIFYSSIWAMADAASPLRLATINVFAVAAMVAWLILRNELWELPGGKRPRERAVLYNAATVLTLLVGVACMYAVLFVVVFLAALAVISPDYLQTILSHEASIRDYAQLAWLTSSMGTVAGALGSGLESEDAVRQATFSRREQERRARLHEEQSANLGPSRADLSGDD